MLPKVFTNALLEKGRALLKEKRVLQILFSEGTYQVEVREAGAKTSLWPFIQMRDSGEIIDAFCSCPTAEKKKVCPHLAAAYLKIFSGHKEPLHIRFRHSLWNQLCRIASHRHGYNADSLKPVSKQSYNIVSATGKQLFVLFAKTPKGNKRLEEILFSRALETEETSIKFSNLSSEEIALWKEGRPSHQLRFELSFWSDLAKWWMLMQEEGEKYQITFTQEGAELPRWIQVSFPSVEFGFYLSAANWPMLIPALATVQSPLPVHEFFREQIKSIIYHPTERKFSIELKKKQEKKKEQELPRLETAQEVGEWLYVPNEGFYSGQIDPLFQQGVVPEDKIPGFLQKHQHTVQLYLKDITLHLDTIEARYQLFFDSSWNLHITCYALEPGDLQTPFAASFDPWVFVEGHGFYLLENRLFKGVEKIVPRENVSDFVNRHRIWLSHHEGFQIHISALEFSLSYQVDAQGVLSFKSRSDIESQEEIVDLGDWFYVKGRGFYPKMSVRGGPLVRAGVKVTPKEIPTFIQLHRDELEQIPGFFCSTSPVETAGLHLKLHEENRIVIEPGYQFRSPYKSSQIKLYGHYTYVEGEGFCLMPPSSLLPEGFQKKRAIDFISEPYFISYELDLLRPWILSIDQRLVKPERLSLHLKQLKRDLTAKTGQWLLDLTYETEMGSISPFTLWQALNEGKKYVFSSAGLIMLKQTRFNWLRGIQKKRWLKEGRLRLSTLEWIRLAAYEEIKEPAGETKQIEESRRILHEFYTFSSEIPLNLEGLQSELRPYQLLGVKWLWFLYTFDLSGLLCDEMGLGKTHQAMALIAAISNWPQEQKLKVLIVCPTSVIYHWEALLKRFLPKLSLRIYYGLQRSLEDDQDGYQILLTSYGIARSEKQNLSKRSFSLAIFDEIQIAKNEKSLTHKALRSINAKMRLGLTGTPIENRLLELKALFDLVLPSYLPYESVFRELFINPIEKSQDPEKKALLSRLIKPFILRRKKLDVLQELPEKTEQLAYCDLSEEQRQLYYETYTANRAQLLTEIQDEKKPVVYLHIFALLSKLKQICDHPCLINKDFDHYQKHASGKWDLFVELLQEARESGQKVVVFSQYLDMLNLIERYLTEQKISYAGIRGSTRDRKEQLDKFRDDPTCEVFVGSLQAAGVGIDLVAASVVIHYDRWWNPAKENQATDRVHRIGQSRGVQVFKMVTKGTIEEHLHQIIERKLSLMEGIIGFDEQDQVKGLERKELIEIFKWIDERMAQE